MLKLFKWLFSKTSKSKKYKPEIILYCYLITISAIVIFIVNIIGVPDIVNKILSWAVLIQWALVIPSAFRIFDIADHNEKLKIMSGKRKFNFKPVKYNLSDIEKWLSLSQFPDTIYVKGTDGKIVIIEVSFEVNGKSGPFVDKAIFINDIIMNTLDDAKQTISTKCIIENDSLSLLAITEFNNPKFFANILEGFE